MKRTHAVAASAAVAAVIAGGAAVGLANHGATAASHGKTTSGWGMSTSGYGASSSGYGAASTSSAMSSGTGVPQALRVPSGNRLVTTLHVLQGVQVYTCTAGTWTFKEPDSTMGAGQRPTVLYTAGPEWVSTTDGSAVWGSPLKAVAERGTIPDLLVKAVKTRGTGLFGHIDYIQRLDTWGGLAPAGHCTDGTITATPYRATENFWAPTSK